MWMYLFGKNDPSRPDNFNLRVMHWINRIAISLFLAGILFKAVSWWIRNHH